MNEGGPPSRHQDLPSQHRDLSPPPDPSERVTTPDINHPGRISPCSPTPLLPSRNPPPSSPKAAPPPSQLTTLPPHPWLPAPLAPGVDPKVPRTANRVYESVVASMLTEAQHKFECLLFVENAYPSIDTQIRWSIQCWEAVCATSQRYFELSKEMRNLVRDTLFTIGSVRRMLNTNRSKGDAPMAGVLSSNVFALSLKHHST